MFDVTSPSRAGNALDRDLARLPEELGKTTLKVLINIRGATECMADLMKQRA
jgi:hypothetical protein